MEKMYIFIKPGTKYSIKIGRKNSLLVETQGQLAEAKNLYKNNRYFLYIFFSRDRVQSVSDNIGEYVCQRFRLRYLTEVMHLCFAPKEG